MPSEGQHCYNFALNTRGIAGGLTCIKIPTTIDNNTIAHCDRAMADPRQRKGRRVGNLSPRAPRFKIDCPHVVKNALYYRAQQQTQTRHQFQGAGGKTRANNTCSGLPIEARVAIKGKY